MYSNRSWSQAKYAIEAKFTSKIEKEMRGEKKNPKLMDGVNQKHLDRNLG